MGNDRASEEGAALRFACVAREGVDVNAARRIAEQDSGFLLFDSLGDAQSACTEDGRIFAVDPGGAVPNLDPYLPPAPVTAAGGLIVRRSEAKNGEPDVLLIFRRGAWDLPKGKLDPGETIEECAVREVQEEVGIDELRVLGEAGTTVHGYPEDGQYLVKTTYWYFMETPERDFTPERREGIEEVAWVPWEEAQERLGYATLRRHLASLQPPAV
jgi:8-oxo-dGTP pyrophosphatase MutT (NUDIX family)